MGENALQRKPRRNQGMSIARLAEHLGLSEGTVSRALNGYPDVAGKTRERVIDAARTLGYSPSSAARRLARGVVETVGFVLPQRAGHFSDPFLAEMLDGVAMELADSDWDLIVAAVPDGHDEPEVIDRLARTGKVGGFILTRTRRKDARVDHLRELGLPFVVHGRTEDCADYAWLDIDNEKAFVDAVRYLVELGHRRIAHIGGDMSFNFAHFRHLGYRRAMEDAELPVPAGFVAEGIADGVAADEAMTAMLSLPAPPTAVVCVTDAVALGAMRAISGAGLRPGVDVSVIGYDGLPFGLAAHPPLTTMSQSSHRAGREVARMLLALIHGAEPANSQVLWEATLTKRASASPPPPH
ncbi:transcriptional regulator, LacI family [Bauldia litoralis]|uniref:Transcriptional regulator, LacI family n=2 Tax=Bauldia litoralis TaxID=665467 RepID=A0A1G6D6R7_9HYPH|nr:transcriptional regulator, LacI family [Bauldia litoralis]